MVAVVVTLPVALLDEVRKPSFVPSPEIVRLEYFWAPPVAERFCSVTAKRIIRKASTIGIRAESSIPLGIHLVQTEPRS